MIVNPYNELISLHDMKIISMEREENTVYVNLDKAYYFSSGDQFILDNPVIIINDIIDIESNKDYPIRIKCMADDEVYIPTLDEFNKFNFDILEEAYGLGLVHFFGVATLYVNDNWYSYDCSVDIHYTGDLEIKWDDKILLEA